MQLVSNSLHFVNNAADVDHLLLVGLKDAMALNDLPDALFVLGECSVLSIDLGFVLNLDLLVLFFQNFNAAKVNLLAVNLNDWPNRVSE